MATSNFYSEVSGTEDKEYTSWKAVHDSIVSFCDRIWMAVKPVLCVDSPEGHTDEPIEDLVVGPKDILSYSWRALRESRYVRQTRVHLLLLTKLVSCCMLLLPIPLMHPLKEDSVEQTTRQLEWLVLLSWPN